VLDFDAERSVVINGPRNKPNGFKLKPTIRAAAVALTGSISGTVRNAGDLPVAYAIAGNDTVTTAPVDAASGYFRLAFLPPQNYSVTLSDTAGNFFSRSNVAVTAGTDFPLGQIVLQ
jgi:hypothetical protein